MTAELPLPRSVLLVGANYWPEESGNAPYTTAFAEDLASHGVEVTALTAVPHYPQWSVREGYRGRIRLRETHAGVRLVRSWLWVPGRQSVWQRALFEGSFLASTLAVRGLRRPDVVVGVTPSLSGAVLARILARRFRVPYGLMVQDLVGPGAVQSGMRGGGAVAGMVRRAELWAMNRAARIAVVSPGFVSYLREHGLGAEQVTLVRNWSHIPESQADPSAVRTRFGLPADAPMILHAGAMGLKQGLDQVVEAARLAQEQRKTWCFVLAGDGSQRRGLERRSRGLDNIHFLPQLSVEDHADLLVAADVLLVSERPGMVDMSLPGKLTSYVSAGRPIVAAVYPAGATAAEVESSGAGVVVPAGHPGDLLEAVEGLLSDTAQVAEMRSLGRVYAREVLDEASGLAECRAFVAALYGFATGKR